MDTADKPKKTLLEPLLSSNEQQEPSAPSHLKIDTTITGALKTIFNLSMYPILGMLFHPAYHIINTSVLGQMDNSDVTLAALGLGTITTSIFLMALGFSLNGSLSTLIS